MPYVCELVLTPMHTQALSSVAYCTTTYHSTSRFVIRDGHTFGEHNLAAIRVHASKRGRLWLYGRKEKTFRQAFYVFFMTATIADCLAMVLVS